MARVNTIEVDLEAIRSSGRELCKLMADRFVALAESRGVRGLTVTGEGDGFAVRTADPEALAREFGTEGRDAEPWAIQTAQEASR